MRILGIDPSVRSTGYAVIEADKRKISPVVYGKITNSPSLAQSACLFKIHDALRDIIRTHQPDAAAVEGIIYVQNRNTAITMGAVRGAVIVTVTESLVPLYEYPARSVKKASTGYGRAGKNQVGFMVRSILGLTTTPGPDEADALAIAITHAQANHRAGPKAGSGKRI